MKKIHPAIRYAAVVLLAALCMTLLVLCKQQYDLPKFQNIVLELGQEMPAVEAFLTPDAKPDRAVCLSEEPDVSKVGIYEMTFRQGIKQETVQLEVRDTTAPEVTFRNLSAEIHKELKPEDFVAEVHDLSDYTISFAEPLTEPESYGDAAAEVVVADVCGNKTVRRCRISYVWMYLEHTMELGDKLTAKDLLLDPARDAHLLKQNRLNLVGNRGVGTYIVSSTDGAQTCRCTVTVQDTTPPKLSLQGVEIYPGESVKLEDFIKSASDLSGEVTTRLMTELDLEAVGEQTVCIEAEDIHGNVVTKETTLKVITDTVPPGFSGVDPITVNKHTEPNYQIGVSAYDEKDGKVPFQVDTSRVDISKAGTYYAIYTAVDRSGNQGTYRRKITVNHDSEDTDALVKSIADSLPDDPEAMRDYVRNTISYNTEWGGNDPVWYGFKNQVGNCYVHALCLQRLLSVKGYTTQLIWVNHLRDGRPSHYWLLINLGGVWRHIDPTPSTIHSRYSLMTDEQRFETLISQGVQRDWDRENWPTCD